MSWRSLLISQPSQLNLSNNAIQLVQQRARVCIPLEDLAVIVLEHAQINLTVQLLSACATAKIVVLFIGKDHLPNGLLLPFLPHHRTLKIMHAQLAQKRPQQKKLQQQLIRQKIVNQALLLEDLRQTAAHAKLLNLANQVRSGDPDHYEAQAAQFYFTCLFGRSFTRQQPRFYNALLNYGYTIVRSAIARSLLAYGFLPAFGLFHHNEQNAFNLADDLIEPFRPIIDQYVLQHFPIEMERELVTADKARLIALLHQDVHLEGLAEKNDCSILKAIEAEVISLQRHLYKHQNRLVLPLLSSKLSQSMALKQQ